MVKDIAVYLDGSDADATRIDHAVGLCGRFDAHLTGLSLNALPQMIVAGSDVALPMQYVRQWEEEAVATGNVKEKELVERLSAQVNLSELRRHDVFTDQISDRVAMQACASDLMVMSRPYGDGASIEDEIVVEACLFGSGRGALIVPPDSVPPESYRRILIGWRSTREATRAVAEAMPFMKCADQVVVALVDEDGPPT